MDLPTEPILFGILLIFILKILAGNKYDGKIIRHPVSIVILINLFWLLVTAITSTMPIVSLKYFLSRLWFVTSFYFIFILLFKKLKNIDIFIWLYVASLIIVVLYTLTRHISLGIWDHQVAHWAMNPFYNDHTSYGAILAMYIPITFAFILRNDIKPIFRFIAAGITLLLIVAVIFSYSRAAWLGIIAGAGIYVLIKLRIKFRYILFVVLVLGGLFWLFKTQIYYMLESNKQDSSANIIEHVESVTNIATDASNLERINRWDCAIDMFFEKPFFGWGPGTYMFQYAPFQKSYNRTIISTDFGDWGNAHSEYLGPLSESGILGTITFLLIIIYTLITAINIYYQCKNRNIKLLIVSLIVALSTYYLHGFLNNFLDTDKASVPFWGFTAIIVALDIYHVQTKKEVDVNS